VGPFKWFKFGIDFLMRNPGEVESLLSSLLPLLDESPVMGDVAYGERKDPACLDRAAWI
jgi:hypothetical protein